MANDDRIQKGILGDIRPTRPSRPAPSGRVHEKIIGREGVELENDEAMQGGSRHDESRRPGSRDVTDGPSGK